ncbi:MAG: amidohydrolase [Wenzhouxiangellaceae bacterium]
MNARYLWSVCLMLPLIASHSASVAESPPAALIFNAVIHTMDPGKPRAGAMAWDQSGRIIALGASEELRERWPGVSAVDLGGRAVIPGLIDAHGHLMGLGLSMLNADLNGARAIDEVVERLRRHAKGLPDGAWLLGRGWDQTLWPGAKFPTASDLDQAFPDRPVLLERVDGHAVWANSAAMARVQRDLSGEWQPEGGHIHRDADGRPTGIFIDGAAELFEGVVPPPGDAERQRALEMALKHLVSLGLTGMHDMGMALDDLRRVLHWDAAGRLPIRIYALADGDREAFAALCRLGPVQGRRLVMRGVKLYADGALGSRGAALLEDYADDPGNQVLLFHGDDALQRLVDRAMGCGLQVAIHAIGDRANRQAIDAIIEAQRNFPDNPGRHRIEHVQIIHADDMPRLAAAGIIASMQPTHATSDMRWAEQRLGKARLDRAYAWRRLLDAGARLALGSDFPVEPANPLYGLHAAVTRQDRESRPPGGWLPDQRLTLEQALRGFTIDAAYAGFSEHEVGSLEVGKRADFVVLDHDPAAVRPTGLHRLKVLNTVVDGRVVHRAENAPLPVSSDGWPRSQ